MIRLAAAATAAAVIFAIAGTAQDDNTKKTKKTETLHKQMEGTWTRTEGEAKITFQIKKHFLRCTLEGGDKKITAEADYGLTKDGIVFGRVSKVEKANTDDGPTAGVLFSFQAAIKDGMLTVSELNAPGNGEAKRLVEGDYKKK
jgi:hypothetical protein